MPEVRAGHLTREVNGIILDRLVTDGQSTPNYVYRRDWALDIRFEYDGFWHRTTWQYRRGEVPIITSHADAWNSLADAVQAARADGLITHERSMPSSITGAGMDGHMYEYHVRDRREDGSLMTESWNAQHLDSCRCITDPESWY